MIDNTSLEQLAMHGTAEHFFKEVQTARIFITKLTTRLEQLESDIQTSRVENDRLMEANVSWIFDYYWIHWYFGSTRRRDHEMNERWRVIILTFRFRIRFRIWGWNWRINRLLDVSWLISFVATDFTSTEEWRAAEHCSWLNGRNAFLIQCVHL